MNNSNEKKARRVATLLAGYMRDTLTPGEHDELDEWVGASDKNMRLFEELTDEKRVQLALDLLNDNDQSGLVKKLKDDQEFVYVNTPFYKKPAFKIAASVILLAGIGIATFWFVNNSSKKTPVDIAEVTDTGEIAPGSSKATLTTNNNYVYLLDKEIDGTLTEEGNSQILKKNDQLVYATKKGVAQNLTSRNILATPRGGNYALVLSDSTKVWLNSASSISYPPVFNDSVRKVVITGEVLFEVASSKNYGANYKKPFIVQVKDNNMSVRVTGTYFNIKAYKDETTIKTTLIHGSVEVSNGKQTKLLQPNQQAQVTESGEIKILKDVQTDMDIAWREHTIKVTGSDLGPALRQISRWYNVELIYEGIPNNTILTSSYSGPLSLNNTLNENLKTFNPTNTPHTHFRIEGRKLIVTVTPS